MSDRRQVRVRRSPKIGVFLGIGAVLGALVAIVAVNITPPDATVPKIQAIGFLILLLAPIGALILGAIALVIDAISERNAKTVDAERVAPIPAPAPDVQPEVELADRDPAPAEDRTPEQQ